MNKVLVTGADGFIGSHLVESLVQSGVSVRALCQYNSFSSWGWLDDSRYAHDIEVILGDVRDPSQMRSVSKGIDTIFHLAALIAIPFSYQAPSSYIDTNVLGTLNVLQAALDCGVDRVIHTSTSEVYGTAKFVPINEEHPLQAQSPYAASKIAADALAFSYYSSYNLPVTIARPFNTYGPRQSSRAVIPTVITQLLSGHRNIRLGSITPTRDFNFVLDTCAGFLALASSEETIGQTLNLGSGTETSIGETVTLIADILGIHVEIICDESRLRPEASEVERLCCDSSKALRLTGHTPTYNLKDGLRSTIEWFQKPENLRRYKPNLFNV